MSNLELPFVALGEYIEMRLHEDMIPPIVCVDHLDDGLVMPAGRGGQMNR
jgi:hypothetical protein